MQNGFCQTFTIRDMGQPLHPAGLVTFTCHLPRDKFCKKYLSDPAVASLMESSQSCKSLDTVPFQRMRCLPGRRHPRGSQWSKWRGKRVWCIQVTCLSHVRRLCRKMLISGTLLASIYTWIKVVLKPTFSRKPYVKIWICILQLQR